MFKTIFTHSADTNNTKIRIGKNKKAFTLAELLIVLSIIGIVASMTVPSALHNSIEKRNIVKVKKAVTVYEQTIQSIIIENNILSDAALSQWADSKNKNNCSNTSQYFKISDGNGCIFKTSDGLWWDIDNISKPIIALKEDDLTDLSNPTTFQLITAHDEDAKAFRTNDLALLDDLSKEDSSYLVKLISYIEGRDVQAWDNCNDDRFCKLEKGAYDKECRCNVSYEEVKSTGKSTGCSECTVKQTVANNTDYKDIVFDENGKMIYYTACPVGQNTGCWKQTMYDDGTYELWQCDSEFNICQQHITYTETNKLKQSKHYDSTGKYTYTEIWEYSPSRYCQINDESVTKCP